MGNSVFHPLFLLWRKRTFFPARLFLFLTQDIINRDQSLDLGGILTGALPCFHINLSVFRKKSIYLFACLRNSFLAHNTLIGKKTVDTCLTCGDTFVGELMAFQDRFCLVLNTCGNGFSFPIDEVGYGPGLHHSPFFPP